MDEFDAIRKYIETILPVETQLGTIMSVDTNYAMVSILKGAPQQATYNPASGLSRGDKVFMARPRGSSELWNITNPITQRATGFSNSNQPGVGKNPGSRAWANPSTMNLSTYYDVTSGTKAAQLELVKTFNGGTPLIIVTGYAAPTTTAATLILGISIDDEYKETFRSYMATTNSYPISHVMVGSGALYGTHSIQIWGAVSPANTIRMNPTQFSVVEI